MGADHTATLSGLSSHSHVLEDSAVNCISPIYAYVAVAMFFGILGVIPERHSWRKRLCLSIAGGLLWPFSMILFAMYVMDPNKEEK